VVVKVLAPELAEAISTRRFQREIQLAARLQHPHIVPLLSAGEADGLLYYTMPFVDGESLRERLRREGKLPIDDTVRILRDVASALAHAHRQGVVHRDIKPENVLLSDGGPVVADFGIAKALSASQMRNDPSAQATTITQRGVALGTPLYMAPEQAVGDPGADHRVDLYALGGVGYEMLAGRPPFDRSSAQELMQAHVMEEPEPITQRRSDSPPPLAALVMRCLRKLPAERPQSADELLRELEAVTVRRETVPREVTVPHQLTVPSEVTGAPQRARSVSRRARYVGPAIGIAAIGIAIVVAAAAFLLGRYGREDAGAASRVAVMPFENRSGDRDLDALGVMAADWVTQGLIGATFLTVHDVRSALAVAQTLGRGATPAAVGRATGASLVVAGSYFLQADSLRFQAQIIATADGSVRVGIDGVTAPRSRPLEGIEQLRQRSLAALASLHDKEVTAFQTRLEQPPTYAAYREYTEGLQAYLKTDWDNAARRFQRAAALDPSFLATRLWAVATWVALDNARADSILEELRPLRQQLDPFLRARFDFMVAGRVLDTQEMYSAALRMVDAAPGSLDAQREAALSAMRVLRAREALRRLHELDPARGLLAVWGDYWSAVAWSHHVLGEHQAELAAAQRGRQLYPANEHYRFLELRALAALGRVLEVDSVARAAFTSAPGQIGILGRAIAGELLAHGHAESSRRLARDAGEVLAARPPAQQAAAEWLQQHRHLTDLTGERERYISPPRAHAPADSGSTWDQAQNEWLHQRAELALVLGDPEAAESFAARLRDPDVHRLLLARVAAARGRPEDARAALERGERRYLHHWGTLRGAALDRAGVFVAMGDRERALATLNETLSRGLIWDSRWGNDGHARLDLTPLWSDSRFRALIKPRD
jgi:tetratricopeptide (TPR) repeat protein/TolB-like protein